ncbi:MAG: hypothetical protein ACI9NT_001542 [Bacteroidia bacterium]|jgi:hypothetical protein
MTLFEYITVAISMVLALTIVHGLDGLAHVYDEKRRYSVHAVWFALKLFHPLLLWWSMWGLRDIATWNFLAFVLGVAGPTFLYLQISTLIPRRPDRVTDWKEHYFSVRKRFFLANIALVLSGPLQLFSLGTLTYGGLLLLGSAGEILMSVIALRSTNHRTHLTIVTLECIGFLFWSLLLFRPLSFL